MLKTGFFLEIIADRCIIVLVCFLALIMMIGSDVVIDISSDVALHVFFCRF